jgi:hypothetical protein
MSPLSKRSPADLVDVDPPGVSGVVLLMLLGLGKGSHTLVNS